MNLHHVTQLLDTLVGFDMVYPTHINQMGAGSLINYQLKDHSRTSSLVTVVVKNFHRERWKDFPDPPDDHCEGC